MLDSMLFCSMYSATTVSRTVDDIHMRPHRTRSVLLGLLVYRFHPSSSLFRFLWVPSFSIRWYHVCGWSEEDYHNSSAPSCARSIFPIFSFFHSSFSRIHVQFSPGSGGRLIVQYVTKRASGVHAPKALGHQRLQGVSDWIDFFLQFLFFSLPFHRLNRKERYKFFLSYAFHVTYWCGIGSPRADLFLSHVIFSSLRICIYRVPLFLFCFPSLMTLTWFLFPSWRF